MDLGGKIGILAKPLEKRAGNLETFAVLSALFGMIGGILFAFQTSIDSLGNTTHPYVALGIGITVAALVQGVFVWCIARALRLFAVTTAADYDIDLTLDAGSPSGPLAPPASVAPPGTI